MAACDVQGSFVRRTGYLCGVFALALVACAWSVLPLNAQTVSNSALALPLSISGEADDGDIISYRAENGTYVRSTSSNDEAMFGIIVNDPVLLMEGANATTARPVVRFGEANVNVSTLGGEVRAGDLLTSSPIPGVARRADPLSNGYILGFALDAMAIDTTVPALNVEGSEVRFGRVPVALRIGPHVPELNNLVEQASTTFAAIADMELDTGAGPEGQGFDTFKMFRYFLGSFVAIAAVVLALRRFGDMFAQSVVSVGRNPLARSQIRSILVWNAVLIVIVSGIGLGIGITIILFP